MLQKLQREHTNHHSEARDVDAGVAHHAVPRLGHALALAAVRAHRQALHRRAEIAERAALLLPATQPRAL